MKDTLKGPTLDNISRPDFYFWKKSSSTALEKQAAEAEKGKLYTQRHARKTKVNHSTQLRVTHPQAHTEENLQPSSYIKQVMNWEAKFKRSRTEWRRKVNLGERERGGTEEGLDLQELLSLSLVPEVTSSGRTRQVRVSTHTHIYMNTHTTHTYVNTCTNLHSLT